MTMTTVLQVYGVEGVDEEYPNAELMDVSESGFLSVYGEMAGESGELLAVWAPGKWVMAQWKTS